jgi:RecA/RadA recombinase
MNALLDKIKKNSTIKEASLLADSKFFTKKDMIQTWIPALNIAFSGDLDGGFVPGLTLWAGPSKHFKSMFSLLMAKAYMDKYPDAVMVFYDCEFGTPLAYFDTLGLDKSRILHIPIMNMEEFKFDCIKQLENLERGDRVIFIIDSLGNMSSKKEMEDAIEGKSVQDMSRAKQMKSIFRMITPYLNRLDIPMVAVNHIYMTQELYSKPIVSGGQGIYLSADNIYILGRQQEKEGTEIIGWNFIINVEKSRYVKEKSKIPISVMFEGGISKWSGLMDIALEGGFVVKPKNGWYAKVDIDTGEIEPKNWRLKDTDCKEFWLPILTNPKFQQYIRTRYKVSNKTMVSEDVIDTELDKIDTSLADFDDLAEGD